MASGTAEKADRIKGGKCESVIFTQIKQCHDSFGYWANASLKDKCAVSEIEKRNSSSHDCYLRAKTREKPRFLWMWLLLQVIQAIESRVFHLGCLSSHGR